MALVFLSLGRLAAAPEFRAALAPVPQVRVREPVQAQAQAQAKGPAWALALVAVQAGVQELEELEEVVQAEEVVAPAVCASPSRSGRRLSCL